MGNPNWKQNEVLKEFRKKEGYVDYDHKYFSQDLERDYEDVGKSLQHEMNLDKEHPGMEGDTAARETMGLAVHMLIKMGTRKSVDCGERFAKFLMANKGKHFDWIKMMQEASEILIGKVGKDDYEEGNLISQLECYISVLSQGKAIERDKLTFLFEKLKNVCDWIKDVDVKAIEAHLGDDQGLIIPISNAKSMLIDIPKKKKDKDQNG